MKDSTLRRMGLLGLCAATACGLDAVQAAPVVSRLTPPSALFSFGDATPPVIARFLPGQRFDLAATIRPDADATITGAEFNVDGFKVSDDSVSITRADKVSVTNSVQVTFRAYSTMSPGIHTFSVVAAQSDGQTVTATGNFEVVSIAQQGRRAKNVIYLIGDGFGIAHRTAARIISQGVQLGKANAKMAIDSMPYTAIAQTHSLNSIVTDSAPGAHCYSTGNKANNNEEGVFPDDTADAFDNPRIEYMGSYLLRTSGKTLGIVTTADVFDATPAAFAVHTSNRGAGTGICDQYLDEAVAQGGLRVLMGGGRKWFLGSGTNGSVRAASSDYVLPTNVVSRWGVAAGAVDPTRDLLGDFVKAGFTYVADKTSLDGIPSNTPRLLGLFSFSNMNVAKDKIDKRRGTSTVVDDFGFPDQPMLDEMAAKALQVLSQNKNGFTLMIEAASIDKQAHAMDTERWLLDTIEFDRAVATVRAFAAANPDTLVVVCADHECAGVNIIGASRVSNAKLTELSQGIGNTNNAIREAVVGVYELAGFPVYTIAADGYPTTTDPDNKMLIGYAGNADRYEDWLTNPLPLQDSQQPFGKVAPLNTYPAGPLFRDTNGLFLVTGQVPSGTPGSQAVHTASDIPVYAEGRGANLFRGSIDNTDVFFRVMQAVLGGAPATP
ncbi:MAG: alkaline phosphatase [Verrucomicrobiota bacterium]